MEIEIQIIEKDNELLVTPNPLRFPKAVGGTINNYTLIIKNTTNWTLSDFNINTGEEDVTVSVPSEIYPNETRRGSVTYKSSRKLQPALEFQMLVSMSAEMV